MTNATDTITMVLVVLALAVPSWAMPPTNGVYPTTEQQWEACCDDRDCYASPVEVLSCVGDRCKVGTQYGVFDMHKARMHQITQMGATEHVCVIGGGEPNARGLDILCVFYKVGMQ